MYTNATRSRCTCRPRRSASASTTILVCSYSARQRPTPGSWLTVSSGKVDLQRVVQGWSPRQATAAPDMLKLDSETWADQQIGGTWSEMFDRDSFLNRHPALAAAAWWIVVTLLGWVAFPLLFVALPRLRAVAMAWLDVLGLLLVAYLTWLMASLKILPNTRGTILRMVALVLLVGGGVGWSQRHNPPFPAQAMAIDSDH